MINLRFSSDLMIYFLFMTFLKQIASFSGKKVADAFHWSSVLIETPDVV